ncbi:roadblock/LC7 domain-containing protein [Streptomyces sp. NBC_01304]|uniref:roadblock/LC7 domain-containing protein n=1 Tax=Streptomyces sp. NBC_01304 TaxID=2903818 RepID=UPI002E1008DE|nr:roadblock/LC7 domain-containing protein [Streptomyces sp. NBC_01304]
MAAEAELTGELGRLRACVPQVTGALVVGDGGRVLAESVTGAPAGRLGARTSEVLGAALRLADVAGQGVVDEFLMRGEHGWVVVCTAGSSAVLALVTEPWTNVGRLRLEARRSSARIGVLIDGALERLENTPP